MNQVLFVIKTFLVNSNDKPQQEQQQQKQINEIMKNNSLNESVTDLIQALKLNDNNKQSDSTLPIANIVTKPEPPKPPTSEKTNSNPNVYSFSSKPKVVDPDKPKNQTQVI